MPGWKYAFTLPSASVKSATPPGTVILIGKLPSPPVSLSPGRREGDDRVVKFPIPTSDPADPLNWPRWRKVTCMVAVAWYAFVANYIASSLAPALPVWNHQFPQDRRQPRELMQLVAFNVLVLGLGNIIWVPLANVFGRRLVLVLSTVVLSAASACGMKLGGFTTMLIIRIFQGLGSSASETVTPAVVGDLFFVHERGRWMAFYTASLACGSVTGGITGGYIATKLGWFRQFWFATGLSGLAALLIIFLVPETMYDRGEHTLPIQQTLPRASQILGLQPSQEPGRDRTSLPPRLSLATLPSMRLSVPSKFMWPLAQELDPDHGMTWYNDAPSDDETASRASRASRATPRNSTLAVPARDSAAQHRPYTFWRSLTFSRYRGKIWYQFAKPWLTLRLPATWVIMLQYGGLVAGVAVISTVGPQILTGKPYGWGENAGLLFVGALVGILLGGLTTGLLVDRRLKKLARDADHGYAEPEARLAVMVPALAIGTCGLLVFGFCAKYPGKFQWVGLEFAYGMVALALAQVPSIWFNYLIDAYEQLASDCFVMICILRGLVPFAWTFFVAQWVARDGFLIPFGGFTAILGGFSLLTLPIMFWGKRMRIATARFVVKNQ
ncbi:uncharacterized protein THITE_2038627 [Thermothielavioides terrestris NRRL 8126]|uniref:Major facilitator superfamily (MFS) profile domain-containing protein n=1 Tax=Thermothielavioides terrestris (strain ATCC 38088 / NRRL 8126) TaxID=578455 RepID=G2QVK1_THETT|nr:uncharacterized protein THITE_2038627 [Thermothielavioides terrestris NRRL 8126]AEO62982.1 hypothetical protein THITE_2038627 [Thermothielavioides terrestris NRRL 8126]